MAAINGSSPNSIGSTDHFAPTKADSLQNPITRGQLPGLGSVARAIESIHESPVGSRNARPAVAKPTAAPTSDSHKSAKTERDFGQKIPTGLDTNWYGGTLPFTDQNKYNGLILKAVEDANCKVPTSKDRPGTSMFDLPLNISPKLLKSMMAKESSFDPTKDNGQGFVGLTQMNEVAAKEGGLVFATGKPDPRKDPKQIIPATIKVLNVKSKALDVGGSLPGKGNTGKSEYFPGFNRYGRPNEQDRVKFTLAAYNAGQGNVLRALKTVYPDGRAKGGVKFEDVEKHLPSETQKYVKEICGRDKNICG